MAIRRRSKQVDVETLSIEPGAPWENGYAESFPSRLRDEFLGLESFEKLSAAKQPTRQRREDYRYHPPHNLLGCVPPAEFAAPSVASVRVTPSP
jgi:transposase InsO family protein